MTVVFSQGVLRFSLNSDEIIVSLEIANDTIKFHASQEQ
jgi:hypothetical protein